MIMKKKLKNILIVGAGGHAKVVIDIIKCEGKYNIIGIIDNKFSKKDNFLNYKILGNEDEIPEIIDEFKVHGCVVAIGDNFVRSVVVKKIENQSSKIQFINCIHPSSCIAFDIKIGVGNVIMAGTTINTSSQIGNHCIINTNSSIDHDNKIFNFVSIAPNAAIGGNVNIDEYSAIGIGASVIHNISVGHNCVIGANSLVIADTKSNSVYYGLPAKNIRKRKQGEKYL